MALSNRRGADHERHLARRLQGRRVGNRGAATADVVTATLAVECKARKTLPAWLKAAMAQAQAAAAAGQLALVVLHEHGARHDDDLVVVRLKDWEMWYGDLPGREEE